MKNKQLRIILLTALLEIVSLGIIIPILPFVIKGFGLNGSWVGISFATASFGMFLGGLVFGRMSDKYGRKKILSFTVVINFIGYLIFSFSLNIQVFLLARFLSGLASAGIGVAQAYISDISNNENRTKNMGLIGAMFGIGFILGPVIGAIFARHSLQFLGLISSGIILINALIVWIYLPESNKSLKDISKEESLNPTDFHHNKKQLLVLFLTSFGVAMGFSANQTILPMLLNDRFGINEAQMGYVFGFIGLFSVLYQLFGIKHTRRILKERGLVIYGLALLTIVFFFFSINHYLLVTFILLIFFPVAYGSINPGINSLIAMFAKEETGKAMGVNISYISIANIFGPLIAGFAYLYWNGTPYIIAGLFFIITLIAFTIFIKVKKQ